MCALFVCYRINHFVRLFENKISFDKRNSESRLSRFLIEIQTKHIAIYDIYGNLLQCYALVYDYDICK